MNCSPLGVSASVCRSEAAQPPWEASGGLRAAPGTGWSPTPPPARGRHFSGASRTRSSQSRLHPGTARRVLLAGRAARAAVTVDGPQTRSAAVSRCPRRCAPCPPGRRNSSGESSQRVPSRCPWPPCIPCPASRPPECGWTALQARKRHFR